MLVADLVEFCEWWLERRTAETIVSAIGIKVEIVEQVASHPEVPMVFNPWVTDSRSGPDAASQFAVILAVDVGLVDFGGSLAASSQLGKSPKPMVGGTSRFFTFLRRFRFRFFLGAFGWWPCRLRASALRSCIHSLFSCDAVDRSAASAFSFSSAAFFNASRQLR